MAVDDVFVFALFSSAVVVVVVVVVVRSGGRSTTTTFTTSLALIPGATSWPFWNDFFRQFFVYLEEREKPAHPNRHRSSQPVKNRSIFKMKKKIKMKQKMKRERERRHSNPIYVCLTMD
jgi:ABC-type nickel/cobalt efflux system permease component RcnA